MHVAIKPAMQLRWRRTIDPLVWRRGHQKHSIGFIDKLYGPITWEGKAG